MKIKRIELKNFKFHRDLSFDIEAKNCLIYGENGTGKSSIYEAIYAIFKVYFRNSDFDFRKFENHLNSELNVKIFVDDTTLSIPEDSYNLPDCVNVDNKNTIYFMNQNLLESIALTDNFYLILDKLLKKYFNTLDDISTKIDTVNIEINESNYSEQQIIRDENVKKLTEFLEELAKIANDIITNHFQEEFIVNFEYDWGFSNTEDDYKYPKPRITLKIDDKSDLKINFNEAKLKLTSIAIFFALIKLEENRENNLKLLVLDDFLTSLDMANRHYIIEYIFDEFKDYQKIILTHNLQFYNLIFKFLKSRNELGEWDNKNIFIRNIDDIEESIIYDKMNNYIEIAQTNLDEDNLEISGLYLRKEFERIIEELRQIREVGAKEKLSNIIEELSKQEDSEDINLKKMQNVLSKTRFYQQVTLHPMAHDDITTDRYRKELDGAIVILKQLNKYLKALS